MRRLLADRADALALCAVQDLGRPAVEVIATDILPTLSALQFLERCSARLLAPRRVGRHPLWLMGCRHRIYRRPRGVVGIIGTWNYPILLNLVSIAQAVTAGNGVLWKPSERMPVTAEALARLLRDSGMPEHLVVTLPIDRAAGAGVVESDIDFLIFTGSTEVGQGAAVRCAERGIPGAMELSGCDTVIVAADADIDLAARAIWYSLTLNSGQTCMSVRRIIVEESAAERLTIALRRTAGDNRHALLIDDSALARTREWFARSAGAKVVVGGGNGGGGEGGDAVADDPPRVRPTILDGAPAEPIFAPLAALVRVADWQAAVRSVTEDRRPLTLAVFTADARRVEAMTPISAGHVIINDVIVTTAHPELPFTATGAAGWGSTRGAEGLLELTVPQVVSARRGRFRPHYDGTDDPAVGEMLRAEIARAHGATWWGRTRATIRLIRAAMRIDRRPRSDGAPDRDPA